MGQGDDIVLFDAMGPPREYAGYKAIDDHAAEFSGWTDPKGDFLEFKVISDGNLALALRCSTLPLRSMGNHSR